MCCTYWYQASHLLQATLENNAHLFLCGQKDQESPQAPKFSKAEKKVPMRNPKIKSSVHHLQWGSEVYNAMEEWLASPDGVVDLDKWFPSIDEVHQHSEDKLVSDRKGPQLAQFLPRCVPSLN